MSTTDAQLVDGKTRTVREMLNERKYGLDFYQREYSWSEHNVTELISDLASGFLSEYAPGQPRRSVANYRSYFLGPVVTSIVDGVRLLVDGQQRLTTLTLLVIYLSKLSEGRDGADDLTSLIYSSAYGEKSFNINVEDRIAVMDSIVQSTPFDPEDANDSSRNIWDRYQTITDQFPDDIAGDALLHFIDWIRDRVVLVEIVATDQDMALEIFETMNDRGMQLTSTDMLKSFLIARIEGEEGIRAANALWRQRIEELKEADNHGDSDFLKTWLRSKYADSIRERRRDASPKDFDLIGTAFHKWVRDNRERVGLDGAASYGTIINRDFDRLSRRYRQLLDASSKFTPGLEAVFYNAHNGVTLQYLPIMSVLSPDDDDASFREKAQLVASYMDLLVARRMVNYQNFGYSTLSYAVFLLTKDLRDSDIDGIRSVLADRVAGIEEDMGAVDRYSLSQRNRSHVAYLLARMTAFVEEGAGIGFAGYVDKARRNRFEVEHIWADHPERHVAEFPDARDFSEKRNRFGDLLLLPKDFNASYGDKPYEAKLPHYFSQNILAKSLYPEAYNHNPSFVRFMSERGLPFKPYPDGFTSSDIDERQSLYRMICEQVWDPDRLGLGGGTAPGRSRDFYLSFGHGDERNWEDARTYGFACAGGGTWYTRTLGILKNGDRIFAYVPGHGYVGAGIVRHESTPAADLTVTYEGAPRRLRDVPTSAPRMWDHEHDMQAREQGVGIQWLATRDLTDAVRFEGMFANQNTVCRLRPDMGIAALEQAFGLTSGVDSSAPVA